MIMPIVDKYNTIDEVGKIYVIETTPTLKPQTQNPTPRNLEAQNPKPLKPNTLNTKPQTLSLGSESSRSWGFFCRDQNLGLKV